MSRCSFAALTCAIDDGCLLVVSRDVAVDAGHLFIAPCRSAHLHIPRAKAFLAGDRGSSGGGRHDGERRERKRVWQRQTRDEEQT
jgi:hypothetical protein